MIFPFRRRTVRTVVLTGRVCNDGPGGYSNPTGALDAYFMVYTWQPPKTPAQEGDLKFYAHTDLGTALKKKGPIGFSACEDRNNTNTTACQDVASMEKI
jgi:hypothetical protein